MLRRDPVSTYVLFHSCGNTVALHSFPTRRSSDLTTVSAPANSSFRGSITHPTQPLCTLRVRRYRRLTQHSLPGASLGHTSDSHAPAHRASVAGLVRHGRVAGYMGSRAAIITSKFL